MAVKKVLLSDSEVSQIGSPASLPLPESNTASPTASPTASLNHLPVSFTNLDGSVSSIGEAGGITIDKSTKNFPPANVPGFKVGDRVIHTNSTKEAQNWRGTVMKVRDDGRFDVEWDERPGNQGKRRVYPRDNPLIKKY